MAVDHGLNICHRDVQGRNSELLDDSAVDIDRSMLRCDKSWLAFLPNSVPITLSTRQRTACSGVRIGVNQPTDGLDQMSKKNVRRRIARSRVDEWNLSAPPYIGYAQLRDAYDRTLRKHPRTQVNIETRVMFHSGGISYQLAHEAIQSVNDRTFTGYGSGKLKQLRDACLWSPFQTKAQCTVLSETAYQIGRELSHRIDQRWSLKAARVAGIAVLSVAVFFLR